MNDNKSVLGLFGKLLFLTFYHRNDNIPHKHNANPLAQAPQSHVTNLLHIRCGGCGNGRPIATMPTHLCIEARLYGKTFELEPFVLYACLSVYDGVSLTHTITQHSSISPCNAV